MRLAPMLDDLPLEQPLPFRDPTGREVLDLSALLVPHPLPTFSMRVCGHGLRSHGVLDGDLLVIDRSIQSQPGQLVVVAHRGEVLLRPLVRDWSGQWLLAPLGPGEQPIPVEIDDVHARRSSAWPCMASTQWGRRPRLAAVVPEGARRLLLSATPWIHGLGFVVDSSGRPQSSGGDFVVIRL